MKQFIILIILLSAGSISYAQKADTIVVTAKTLNIKNLKPGESHYLLYFSDLNE